MIPLEQRIIDCDQGSADWFTARVGCVTSSRVADCIAKLKKKDGEAACRREVKLEMACELLTGKPSQHYVSVWMEQGIEREPLARVEYEMRTGRSVEQIGFIYHPTISRAGASPDGLVGSDGLIEIKCPKTSTHLTYLIEGVVPETYLPQILWQLACTGRKWCDFVSYDPDLPDDYQLFIKRLERTPEVDAIISGMELEVTQFLDEVATVIAKLKESVQ